MKVSAAPSNFIGCLKKAKLIGTPGNPRTSPGLYDDERADHAAKPFTVQFYNMSILRCVDRVQIIAY